MSEITIRCVGVVGLDRLGDQSSTIQLQCDHTNEVVNIEILEE